VNHGAAADSSGVSLVQIRSGRQQSARAVGFETVQRCDSLPHAAGMQHAACSMQHATCNMQHATKLPVLQSNRPGARCRSDCAMSNPRPVAPIDPMVLLSTFDSHKRRVGQTAILQHLRSPPPFFADVVRTHLTLKRDEIKAACTRWFVLCVGLSCHRATSACVWLRLCRSSHGVGSTRLIVLRKARRPQSTALLPRLTRNGMRWENRFLPHHSGETSAHLSAPIWTRGSGSACVTSPRGQLRGCQAVLPWLLETQQRLTERRRARRVLERPKRL
jgi:hypothetical protein